MMSLRSLARRTPPAPPARTVSGPGAPQKPGRLRAQDLCLAYAPGAPAVVEIDLLEVAPGAAVGITGPSGSGKTSLLYLLTGIQLPQAGRIIWGEVEITLMGESARDRWRRQNVGFVFQDFHLVPGMSVMANVLIAATFDRLRIPSDMRERARMLLERVGVTQGARPVETLSRGEQQRVALARALLRASGIVVADEPTASLDAASGAQVIDLLLETARDARATLLAVTHDPRFLERLETVYWLQGGRLSRR